VRCLCEGRSWCKSAHLQFGSEHGSHLWKETRQAINIKYLGRNVEQGDCKINSQTPQVKKKGREEAVTLGRGCDLEQLAQCNTTDVVLHICRCKVWQV
jgi:hypothetical protein